MADTSYVSRNFTNPKKLTTSDEIYQNFKQMLNKVGNMTVKNGPVYHTWIRFQVGSQDNTKAVTFNTDTQNPNQNLIANLQMEKAGANCCNSFTLQIYYDPFNHGQESNVGSQLEVLDEILADALGADLTSGNENNSLRGIIQYGYSVDGDDSLVSPKYEFFLTDVKSQVKVSSGITNYTFSGTTTLASDCEFTTSFEAVDGSYWSLMDYIRYVLFQNYGDNENKPEGETSTCPENNLKYRIDIPKELLDDQLAPNDWDGYNAIQAISPIQYCMEILAANPLTKSEKQSGIYEDYANLDATKKPGYSWYVTDVDGVRTIHITHYSPDKESSTTGNLDMPTITWSKQQINLVTDWNPSVDTKLYLIRRAQSYRIRQKLDKGQMDYEELKEYNDKYSDLKVVYENDVERVEQSILENYNAELTLIGIPGDVAINSRIKVIPTVLETVSRTAGIYIIKSATDNINNNGVYTTNYKLFRISDIDEYESQGKYTSYEDWYKANFSESSNNTILSGGPSLPPGVDLG